MSVQDKDQVLLKAIRQSLDQSSLDIDAETRSRLAQIRHQALRKASYKAFKPVLLPIAAIATACLVFAMVVFIPAKQIEHTNIVDDIELISSSESLQLYEDLEFYEWLEDYELPT
ncbi:MAG: hypothetical protein O6928_05665 [Gammaproteobacteria bacterium]|nr:hypothetical protein [Gammaproteobacteria bacterium]